MIAGSTFVFPDIVEACSETDGVDIAVWQIHHAGNGYG